VRKVTKLRAAAAFLLGVLGVSAGGMGAGWQFASHAGVPAALMTVAAVALACAVIALLAQSGCAAIALTAGPLRQRAAALRRKSLGAAFQRQLNPDAAGRPRPRAPSAAPAAA
jgi:hypothetical protein